MSLSLLSGLKRLWHAWNIRSCILLSLLLQAFLLLSAPLRKRNVKKLLLGLLWLAYLLWDSLDTFVIGLISRNKGDPSKLKNGNEDFMAFWASFLLLHLGGPDAITSFAIEDNQFWLRHLTQFFFQVQSTGYIFYLSFPQSTIWIPTGMVFLAGIIKYAERLHALYNACLDRIEPLEQGKAYHGLDYEEAVRIHYSVSSVDVPKHVGVMPREVEYAEDSKNKSARGFEYHIRLLKEASRFFDMLKGFIVGTIFSSIQLEESKQYFLNRTPDEAFRLIEYELSFLYDLFHTKDAVVRSRCGYFFRPVCFSLILGASLSFLFIEKQHEFPNKMDVKLSYALLTAALAVEIINALRFLFSDRTAVGWKGSWIKFFPEGVLRRQRWSGSCFQYDMIRYCLNGPPMFLCEAAASVCIEETLDKMYIWASSRSRKVEKYLEDFIFTELRNKSSIAKNLQAGMEACSQRGDRALLQSKRGFKLKWSIEEYEYGESLLLWHVATEICYQKHLKDKEKRHQEQEERHQEEICKQLSDYMFYLFVMQPTLMAPVLGGWEGAFEDTCAEAKRFFKRKRLKGSDQQRACEKIFDVKTPVRPVTVKGSSCKSVLFDASILAKQLQKLGNDQWKVMSQVWMELMSYAAINSRPIQHAQQPSRGGELLTFVWLLMNHLGLGTPFYKYERQTRTKMVNLE